MSVFGAISLLCLVVTAALATWAIFSSHFDDTVLQRLGLSIVSISCTFRAIQRVTEVVADPPPALLAAQIGLCAYAIGTAWKMTTQARRRAERRMKRRWIGGI
jgi:hypothetical protein